METAPGHQRWHDVAWTGLLIGALFLIVLTQVLTLRSDDSSRQDVTALLVSEDPMVVLRREPDISAGISGLLSRLQRVTVVEFDPTRNPDWVLVRSGDTTGWVPLDRLSEKP
jgi:hypothetical protein